MKPSGNICVYLDPIHLHKAIRDFQPIPVVDIIPEMKYSILFIKLYLNNGYWLVKLTEEASSLTTFATPFGRYRYNRLSFGLCVSQDIFKFKVDQTFGNCIGAI